MDAIGKPEYKTDPRFSTNEARIREDNRRELNRVISEWLSTMTMDEALAVCAAKGLTLGMIANMCDIAENPHVLERKSLVDIVDPVTGRELRMPDVAIRVQRSAGQIRFAGMPMGSANDVIYGDLLGYTSHGIERLRSTKVI